MTHDQDPNGRHDRPRVPALLDNRQLTSSDGLSPDAPLRRYFVPEPAADQVSSLEKLAVLPFADLPLILPTVTAPVPGHDGGFNAAALAVNPSGVICVVPGYLDQFELDFISIEINGEQADFHLVTEEEARLGKPTVLFIESSRFIDQANNTIQAFVEQLSGNIEETRKFNILANRELPVGRDPIYSTPYNENMAPVKFADPQIEAFELVTQEHAIAGVEIVIDNYPLDRGLPQVHHRKADDVIHLSIGGKIIKHTVTPFEASGTLPISIWVYYGTWSQLSDGKHAVEWRVFDKVGNGSPGASPPRLLELKRGSGTEPLLPAVHVTESDYDDKLEQDFIDIRTLGGDANIELLIRNQGYAVNDLVELSIKGVSAASVSTELVLRYTVTAINLTRVNIPLPIEFLLPLPAGRILITYKRIRPSVPDRPDVPDRPSDAVLYAIYGDPVDSKLPPPQVLDLVDNTLPETTNPVRIRIKKYLGQKENDRIALNVVGYTVNGTPRYAEFSDMAGTEDILFLLENAFFAELNGGYFTVHYTINGDSRPPSESVTVPVGNAQGTLPQPRTLQAVPPDFTFNPGTHRANLNVYVDPHEAIVDGVRIRVVALGSEPGGSIITPWFEVDDNWEGAVIPFTIARTIVLINDGGTMSLYFEVDAKVPGVPPRQSLPLLINVGMARKLPPPIVVEAESISPILARLNPLHVLPPNPAIVTIRVVSDTFPASADLKVHITGKDGIGTPNIPIKPAVPTPGENYTSFTAPSTFVAAYLAGHCTVSYDLIETGRTTKSEELTLEIAALSEQEWDLVSVPQANGGVIDTSKPHDVQIHAWKFNRVGQPVWIEGNGTVKQVLRNGAPLTSAEFAANRILTPIPAEYLRKLDNDSTLEIKASVSLDDNGSLPPQPFVPVNYRIRTQTGIVGSINVGGGPDRIVINAQGTVAYVANYNTSTVSVIDLTTFRLTDSPNLSGYTNGLALHPDGLRFYVSGEVAYDIQVATTIDNKYSHSISGLEIYGTGALAFNADSSRLYYASWYYGTLHLIDTTNDSLIFRRAGYGYAYDFALAPEGTRLYSAGATVMGIIDTASNAALPSLAGFTDIRRLAYSPRDSKIYLPDSGAGNLKIVDTRTNSIIGLIPNLAGAFDVAFHPTRPLAYVTMTSANSVAIIDTDREEVINIITGFVQPKGIAIDPSGSFALVSNYTANTVFVVQL
ncbi:YncE family protein [Pseudomonas sp. MUP55]|uniref:YncE family protein n=1 Tax=Pseudomonas sp. MUP55 TaxID=3087234 RepID=UPI002A599C30|nr:MULTISPECIES: YncE family protein [unclassified Pseudomonas]WPN94161.1 YncE family protein [Pseudomonas sp. MUP56]WPN99688.1 YncE family protein [Pseudomonas sp. MUP55]